MNPHHTPETCPAPGPLTGPESGSEASRAGFALLVGPRSLNASMQLLIARLGAQAALHVLDAGNRFNAYRVARLAGGRTEVLDRITVARAFTCYQVLALLESTQPGPPRTGAADPSGRPGVPAARLPAVTPQGFPGLPARLLEQLAPPLPAGPGSPARRPGLVVLDLLNTFYDESVQAGERKRLLQGCIAQLQRLGQAAEGAISLHPPAVPSRTASEMLEMLRAALPETYFIQVDPPAPAPLQLF
jgi:hypothetical protein